jgi:hypothetical protein
MYLEVWGSKARHYEAVVTKESCSISASKNVRRVVLKARENSINIVIVAKIWCRIEKAIGLPRPKEINAEGLTTWIWEAKEGSPALKWITHGR